MACFMSKKRTGTKNTKTSEVTEFKIVPDEYVIEAVNLLILVK